MRHVGYYLSIFLFANDDSGDCVDDSGDSLGSDWPRSTAGPAVLMGTKFEMNNGSSFKIRGKRKATFRRSKNQDVLLRGPRPVFHPQGIFVSFKATTSKRDQGAREMVSSRLSLGHHQDGDVETIKTLPKNDFEILAPLSCKFICLLVL